MGLKKGQTNGGSFKKGQKKSLAWQKARKKQVGENNPFWGRKHTEETKERLRLARSLQISPAKGRPKSQETKDRISITKKNQFLLGEKSSVWKGGYPKCQDCGKILSRRKATFCLKCLNKGERAPNWKGGITPVASRIRGCFKYKEWRSAVFGRDNFTCQTCGVRGVYLEADHFPKLFSSILHENKIKDLEDALDCVEMWDTNNGRTLCRPCHDKTKKPSIFYKLNNNITI